MTYRHGNGIPPAEADLTKSKAVTFCKIDYIVHPHRAWRL